MTKTFPPVRHLIILLILAAFPSSLQAQDTFFLSPSETEPRQPSSPNRTLLVGSISAGILTGFMVFGTFAWWKDKGRTGWSWKQTGFFGADTYVGGADKAGHIYAYYVTSKGTRQIYQWMGVPKKSALILGTGVTFFVSTAVEVVDGFTEHGFEWTDVVANLLGMGFFLTGELVPSFDELFGMRISYVPTYEFVHGEKNYVKLVNDYSGMIFYLDLRLAGLEKVTEISLGPARYFTLGLTYGTYGYSPGRDNKRRNLGFYIGLNFPEILESIWGTKSRSVRAASTFTRYYALPFTTASLEHDLNHGTTTLNFGVANRMQYPTRE